MDGGWWCAGGASWAPGSVARRGTAVGRGCALGERREGGRCAQFKEREWLTPSLARTFLYTRKRRLKLRLVMEIARFCESVGNWQSSRPSFGNPSIVSESSRRDLPESVPTRIDRPASNSSST
eukprot:4782500-Prymnesium_polylepis.2